MKLDEIENAIRRARESKGVDVFTYTESGKCGAYVRGAQSWIHTRIDPWLSNKSKAVALEVKAKLDEIAAEFEAMAKGLILEARQEERPDAYLDEIVKAFGPHQGLNANWAVMAWHLGGEVWLCCDENDKTVSIVTRRITTEIDEIVQVASNVAPARALQIWAMISEEGR